MRSALVFFAPINRSGWATDGSNSSSYSKRNTENRGKRESSYRVGSATQWKSTNEREISLSQFIILPATVVINRSLRFNFGQGFRLGVSVKPTWSLATTRNVEFKRVILEELERVQTRTRNFSTKGEIGGTSRIAGFSRIREFVLRDRRERFRLNVIYLLHSHETDREKGRGQKKDQTNRFDKFRFEKNNKLVGARQRGQQSRRYRSISSSTAAYCFFVEDRKELGSKWNFYRSTTRRLSIVVFPWPTRARDRRRQRPRNWNWNWSNARGGRKWSTNGEGQGEGAKNTRLETLSNSGKKSGI